MAKQDGVKFHTFDQCELGAEFEKKTDVMSNIDDDIMAPFQRSCTHHKMWWVVPWSGRQVYSSHPPLRGRQKAIPFWEWRHDMLREREPPGEYLTRGTAAYPKKMNESLVNALVEACKRRKQASCPRVEVSDDPPVDIEPRVNMMEPLKGAVDHSEEDEANSLRNIHKWITPRMRYVGKQVQNLVNSWLDKHSQVQSEILDNLGKPHEMSAQATILLEELRHALAELLSRNRTSSMETSCSTGSVATDHCNTEVRGYLLKYWAHCVDDPGKAIADWLISGAPAGLSSDTSQLDGVFPRVDNTREAEVDDLATDYMAFENYAGVEENEEAIAALASYAAKGYLRKFKSLWELQEYLQAKPILSKIGCIVKNKKKIGRAHV